MRVSFLASQRIVRPRVRLPLIGGPRIAGLRRAVAWAAPAVLTSLLAAALARGAAAQVAPPRPDALAARIDPYVAKQRLFVLTDIANEPDDQMSLVRLLVYSNQFDIEGLVATTSTWMKGTVRPDVIREVIGAYAQVRSNLNTHASGFPSADALLSVVASGQPAYGMAAVGPGRMSAGAALLIRAADRADTRPLWVTVWGGANTLAQALLEVRATRTPAELARFVDRLRVYTISDQDDAGAWIRREFPTLHYIATPSTQDGDESAFATWTGISGDRFYHNAPGADFTTFTDAWVDAHVRAKGPLGAHYPRPCCIHEGDTPSYLGLIDNGLASAMSPTFGGWGGRYVWRRFTGETGPHWTQGGDSWPGRDNSRDAVVGTDGRTYVSDQATIWRWREAFQHDFAARMDWTVQPYRAANHNPEAVVNGQGGRAPMMLRARVGVPVVLDAAGSRDPDGNTLHYRWFAYPEAGTGIPGHPVVAGGTWPLLPDSAGGSLPTPAPRVTIEHADAARAIVTPRIAGTMHVLLAVEDDGAPSLTSYRRVILEIAPAAPAAGPAPRAPEPGPQAAGAAPNGAPRATADPRFDWFEYVGRDSVLDAVRAGPGDYHNPVIAGFYPDPSVTRVGDDYYLVNSTFGYFPGIPVFHSRDLVSWTQIGNVIDRPSQLAFDTLPLSRGVFAPTIREHAGTFYVVNTCVDCGGNFIVTAKNPAGPWSDPVWLKGIGGIDPSLFFDGDRVYVVHNDAPQGPPRYAGHTALWMQELDRRTLQPVGPHRVLLDAGIHPAAQPRWIEGPHIFTHAGHYYLMAAEGGTEQGHSEVILRSDSLWGPYVAGPVNPILTQRTLPAGRPSPVTSTGHADLVATAAGDWWAVFLGVRPYAGEYVFNTGRETFLLPVTWKDGWPFVTTARVPYVHARPRLARQAAPPVPTAGNFRVRDEFDAPRLAPSWLMIRTPRDTFVDLRAAPGALTLRARPVELSAGGQPSYVGWRQQHLRASASTAMRYAPSRPGDKAGLAAFQNDDHYFLLGVTMRDGRRVVQLERRAVPLAPTPASPGTSPAPTAARGGEIVAVAPLSGAADAPVYLKIDAHGARYDFSYGTRPGVWTTLLRDADGTILSSQRAGGFIGATLGLFAYAAP